MTAAQFSRFQPPSIAHRGKVARLMAQVHAQKPAAGEKAGLLRCICGSKLRFNVSSAGASSAHCISGCGVRWL